MELVTRKRYAKHNLQEFADKLLEISAQIGRKVSARGWCYILEGNRFINKDQFDKVEGLINNCRKAGLIPVDFVAEEKAREFDGVVEPDTVPVVEDAAGWLRGLLNQAEHYNPDWWQGEKYYIQIIVEKVDLVDLFLPVCKRFKIPIANSKGWGSVLQRATYARRFKAAEERGLKCVLLYCDDHDPDGLRISEFLRSNLADLSDVVWEDGEPGYDPSDLIIDRFGLNYDLIQRLGLTWIDNLITGSGLNLASAHHKNYKMPYLQDYLKSIGERKCEANSIVIRPREAEALCLAAILKYLGDDAPDRFRKKRERVRREYNAFLKNSGLKDAVDSAMEIISDYDPSSYIDEEPEDDNDNDDVDYEDDDN